MQETKAPLLNDPERTFWTQAGNAIIEEKKCDLAIKKWLVIFYICNYLVCYLFLFVMISLFLLGRVSVSVFLVSQIMNAVIRGIGKGLQRITESEFPARK
ncbi:MAG TPA: hypothetical protein VGO56_03885 [Pyrinomonadaceae bacterium]|jgi:hypothetical protein|nr:hypothetical protein [Pyrinomonadaceae bacterium]